VGATTDAGLTVLARCIHSFTVTGSRGHVPAAHSAHVLPGQPHCESNGSHKPPWNRLVSNAPVPHSAYVAGRSERKSYDAVQSRLSRPSVVGGGSGRHAQYTCRCPARLPGTHAPPHRSSSRCSCPNSTTRFPPSPQCEPSLHTQRAYAQTTETRDVNFLSSREKMARKQLLSTFKGSAASERRVALEPCVSR